MIPFKPFVFIRFYIEYFFIISLQKIYFFHVVDSKNVLSLRILMAENTDMKNKKKYRVIRPQVMSKEID